MGDMTEETRDRILLGGCAASLLIWLGASVAALVALADLGRGFGKSPGSAHSGVLYVVIGVSGLVILASIPLLIHARRGPQRPAAPGRAAPRRPVQPPNRGIERLTTERFATGDTAPPGGDRIWLRGTASLVTVLAGAASAAAVATYLMAMGKDGAAWGMYGLAGVLTAGAPAVLWWYLRELRELTLHRPAPGRARR